jgi:hypothetical protein
MNLIDHQLSRRPAPAATDEDGADQIGYDTPRSGVATPQPDLHDRRLPGIMSYFGQSGTSTPTRAMSVAHPSISDRGLLSNRGSNASAAPSRSQTPRPSGPGGTQVPVTKGKLTIRIAEARGLKACTKPYIVVVFQRNELISVGDRHSDDEDEGDLAATGVGSGIPVQRHDSDSGRSAMAIPMRSRQSSNTI